MIARFRHQTSNSIPRLLLHFIHDCNVRAKRASRPSLKTDPEVAAKSTVKPSRRHYGNGALHVAGTGLWIGSRSPTDIFSFGAVLYELLTGKQAFGAGSAGETMSAILKDEPEELSNNNGWKTPQHP